MLCGDLKVATIFGQQKVIMKYLRSICEWKSETRGQLYRGKGGPLFLRVEIQKIAT